MKRKNTYITLASMIVLGGLVTSSDLAGSNKAQAEGALTYEVVDNEPPSDASEPNAPLDYFGLYTNSGVVFSEDVLESDDYTLYDYVVGTNFNGGLRLSQSIRPNYTYNMTYKLTKSDFDGKNSKVLVDNEKYTENQDISVAGKGAGIYNFIIKLEHDEPGNKDIIVNATIYERDGISFNILASEKDPKELKVETESDIESMYYSLIGVEGTIIKDGEVNGTKLPTSILEDLPKGLYTLNVEAYKEHGLPEGMKEVIKATDSFKFEITTLNSTPSNPNVTVTIDQTTNPTDIEGTPSIEDSELTWSIVDSKKVEVAKGTETYVENTLLKDLKDGMYTITYNEKALDGVTNKTSVDFSILKPSIKITLDAKDPKTIEAVTKGNEVNTFSWEISEGGNILSFGEELKVPNSILNILGKGDYKVTYTETDDYGNVSKAEESFNITAQGNAGVIEGLPNIEEPEVPVKPTDPVDPEKPIDPEKPVEPNVNPELPNNNNDNNNNNNGNIGNNNGTTGSNPKPSVKPDKPTANTDVGKPVKEQRALLTLEIEALHWGKTTLKDVTAPVLNDKYGYVNISKDNALYLGSWDSEKDGIAAENKDKKYQDATKYSDGTWRNNNIVDGEDFGKNLDKLVSDFTNSTEGKKYLSTPEGKESAKNYEKSLQKTDKSSVMLSLGFLVTAIGLGFLLKLFFEKKKKTNDDNEPTESNEPIVEDKPVDAFETPIVDDIDVPIVEDKPVDAFETSIVDDIEVPVEETEFLNTDIEDVEHESGEFVNTDVDSVEHDDTELVNTDLKAIEKLDSEFINKSKDLDTEEKEEK